MNNDNFHELKDIFFKSKKYLLIYLILIAILGLSTVSKRNFSDPTFEIIMFIIVAVMGIFSILFYFSHSDDNDLYKVAFVIILLFGITAALIVPICDVSDEVEHLTRAEITSQGVLVPHWTGDEVGIDRLYNHSDEGKYSNVKNNNVGFQTIQSHMFFNDNREKTVFDVEGDTDKIDYRPLIDGSAFEQNPFFGYLPQAIGILIAKLLDLNVIWILWLGRIGNLVCYACLISLAIRKTPVLKMPLLAVACIPITIYQAASVSIDSMIIGLGILAIAYFIYMIKAEKDSIEIKDMVIFTVICLLLGLCKLTYLAFIFLLLFVPRDNFAFKKALPASLASISIVAGCGVLWSRYSTPTLMHSWRSKLNYVNSAEQVSYFIHHPMFAWKFISQIFTTDLAWMVYGIFNFFSAGSANHYANTYYFIFVVLLLFLIAILIFYPENNKFGKKIRLGSLLVLLIVYVGTCFVQLLTWAGVGYTGLGINTRYFIPLIALIPIIIGRNYFDLDKSKFDKYSIILIIVFMATLILAFTTKYY